MTHQVPLSMGFPRQEYWCELLFLSPGDLSNQRIEPEALSTPPHQVSTRLHPVDGRVGEWRE